MKKETLEKGVILSEHIELTEKNWNMQIVRN